MGGERQQGREDSWQIGGWRTQQGGRLWSPVDKATAGRPGDRPQNPGFQLREIKENV